MSAFSTFWTRREYGAVLAHAQAITALRQLRANVQRDIDDAALAALWVGVLLAALQERAA